MSLDTALFDFINGGGSPGFDVPMALLSYLGTVYAFTAIPPIAWRWGRHAQAVDYLLLFLLVEVVTAAIKLLLAVPRPVPLRAVPWAPTSLDPAFPSGHAARCFALAAFLGGGRRSRAAGLYGFAALVSLSRVYLGAHLPSQVLAGAVEGTVLALLLLTIGLHPGFVRRRQALVVRLEGLLHHVFQGPHGLQDLPQGGQGTLDVPGEG